MGNGDLSNVNIYEKLSSPIIANQIHQAVVESKTLIGKLNSNVKSLSSSKTKNKLKRQNTYTGK